MQINKLVNWSHGVEIVVNKFLLDPGWQDLAGFRRGQKGHEIFRQARFYNFRDKCVVFARNLKFSNSTQ